MSHHYCDSWTETEDADEYVTTKGYWTCYVCSQTIDEFDDDYEFPE